MLYKTLIDVSPTVQNIRFSETLKSVNEEVFFLNIISYLKEMKEVISGYIIFLYYLIKGHKDSILKEVPEGRDTLRIPMFET